MNFSFLFYGWELNLFNDNFKKKIAIPKILLFIRYSNYFIPKKLFSIRPKIVFTTKVYQLLLGYTEFF